MRFLKSISTAMDITVEFGLLPGGEAGRYIDDEQRIIIRSGMSYADTYRVFARALGHAHYRDTTITPENTVRAQCLACQLMACETLWAAGLPYRLPLAA